MDIDNHESGEQTVDASMSPEDQAKAARMVSSLGMVDTPINGGYGNSYPEPDVHNYSPPGRDVTYAGEEPTIIYRRTPDAAWPNWPA